MADIRTFLSFSGLTKYDVKIKEFIAAADLTVMNKVSAAQAEIDALELLVGTLPEGTTAKDVVEYVNLKTTGIATDEALGQLQTALEACQAAVDAIEADYLKAADKTELSNAITAEADRAKAKEDELDKAIKAEAERATGIEGGLETRLAAVEADYLKEEHRAALAGAIETEKERAMAAEKVNSDAIAVLNGDGDGSVKKTVDEAINKFATDVTNDEVVNSYKELIDWVAEHGPEAAEMAAAIEDNADAIEALTTFVGTLPEGETSETVVAFVQKLVAAEQSRAEGVESGHNTRLEAVETAVGISGGKSVAEQITEAVSAVQGEVDALEEVVATKADKTTVEGIDGRLETAEGEIDQLQTDLDAAEELLATKAAQADVTTLQGDMTTAKADIAQLKTDVDAAEELLATKAAQADLEAATGRITTLEGEMDAVEALAAANKAAHEANAAAIALKASQEDFDDLEERVATNEDGIAANKAAIEAFVEITEEEINGLFTA